MFEIYELRISIKTSFNISLDKNSFHCVPNELLSDNETVRLSLLTLKYPFKWKFRPVEIGRGRKQNILPSIFIGYLLIPLSSETGRAISQKGDIPLALLWSNSFMLGLDLFIKEQLIQKELVVNSSQCTLIAYSVVARAQLATFSWINLSLLPFKPLHTLVTENISLMVSNSLISHNVILLICFWNRISSCALSFNEETKDCTSLSWYIFLEILLALLVSELRKGKRNKVPEYPLGLRLNTSHPKILLYGRNWSL